MREVAALAGVSRQTVSRVVNGHPSIRESTRQRVLTAMDELQFRPNRAARMLSTARSNTIGILASSSSSLFGPASSIDAVESAAREAGSFVAIAHLASVETDEIEAALDHLMAQAVEGIVVVAPQRRVLDAMHSVSIAVPSVTMHSAEAAGDEAFADQIEGARMAARHLAELGHTTVAHLAGPSDWAEANARRDGFLAEARTLGMRVTVTAPGDWTSASGARIGADLLRDRTVTAVFSSNDQMALGVLHALRRDGRSAPQDVSVIGFDDIPEAAYFAPPLTTIRPDFTGLGRTCVARLLAAIDRLPTPGAGSAVVTPRLIVRESTGPAPTR
ncbi:LacI family DNA-binding transcriptional regulator [Leifsonia poae]|uniref:LacI family DNA-binding transcriptional regulator n=1 Tax=Leifsonia poae TaxID=110933 RepID=UPI001CBFBED9|nr:LacI family DNA-binding transcriptional regulator [Leifsonia poae]